MRLWALVLLLGGNGCAAGTASPAQDPAAQAATLTSPDMSGATPTSDPQSQHDVTELDRRLTTSGMRQAAVDDLVQEYQEVAKNGSQTAEARAFVERHADAATRAYVEGRDELAQPTREQLLRVLISFDTDRTTPAFVNAIERYTQNAQGVNEAILACQGAMQRKTEAYQDALLAAFRNVDASDKDGLRYSRHLAMAMGYQASAAWVSTLQEVLGEPLKRPARFDDANAVKAYQSGLFRQTIAARLLGDLQAAGATDSLLQVLLDADKRELHPAAELSLAQLAPSLLPRLLGLLASEDAELVALTRKARPDLAESHLYFATKWLDLLRHPNSEGPLLDAWANTKNPISRTLIVRSLSRLPASKAGLVPLQTTFLSTNIKATLPEGESALEALAESVVQFYDPTVVQWLNERSARVPAVWSRRGDVQHALIMAMNMLVTADALKAGQTAAQKYGGKGGMQAFDLAKGLVQQCASDSACYAQALGSSQNEPFLTLKAATMIAVLGGDAGLDALLQAVNHLESPEALTSVLLAIEHLSVRAPQTTTQRLEQAVAQSGTGPASTWPRAKTAAVQATIARLRAW